MISRVTRYMVYFVVSVGLGWFSTLGENDFILNISGSIVQWLIALFAICSTIMIQAINNLIRFRSFVSVDTRGVIKSLRHTSIILVVIIGFVYLSMLIIQYLHVIWQLGERFLIIVQNSIITFSLLYFVWAICDASMALYDLLNAEEDLKAGDNDSSE